jgi:hypothetical protein
VLTVTTSEERIGTCVKALHALQHARDAAKRFLFAAKPVQDAGGQRSLVAMPWVRVARTIVRGTAGE